MAQASLLHVCNPSGSELIQTLPRIDVQTAMAELDRAAIKEDLNVEILQCGLVPADKALRVAQYARQIVHSVGLIAHACGAAQPRALRREHLRIIQSESHSVPMVEVFPSAKVRREYEQTAKQNSED